MGAEGQLDLVITGGEVVTVTGASRCDVGVQGGKIAVLADPGVALAADKRVDATGRIVIPGCIDAHTHIEWPLGDGASLDTFPAATRAAAISGTTCVIDFVPPPSGVDSVPSSGGGHLEAAQSRLAMAEGRSAVDYSFHPMITDASSRTCRDIERLVEMGLASFKIFTIYDERVDDGAIRALLRAIGEAGGVPGFHAENAEIVAAATASIAAVAGGRGPIREFERSRPAVAEAVAIDTVSLLAREAGTPLYVYHVSGAEGVAALHRALDLGVPVASETCAHYLLQDDGVFAGPDGWKWVITPPIRGKADCDALWRALADGPVTGLSSDHCAYGLRHKNPGGDDFLAMTAGAPGLDARVPLLWSAGVGGGRLTVEQFVAAAATNPAKAFGLYPRKGVIAVGADADLVLIDPEKTWRWPAFETGWGSDYEPWEGVEGAGLPVLTIQAGRIVAQDGVFCGGLEGRFLPQRPDPALWPSV